MLLLKSIRRHQDRSMMLDSLVRVSRRAAYSYYASILADARTLVQASCMSPPL
ncbi:hypothetical protein K460DRAFT_425277 [Cucurbitaria berberidis CBS 394.84]|uniref:Uncharacterized protein n=1 Tax=Cucurbitaria berberidis CBS 394.84 TaxID=1168544 RepID=A0A9P4G6F0_9PLEO|nr:hypothetical protein K460DRAFT_425277 [Cucurbitaria berberidis CBS 394.84]